MKIDPLDIQFTGSQTDPPADQLEAIKIGEVLPNDPMAMLFSIHHISVEQAKALFELEFLNERELAFVLARHGQLP